MNFKVTIQGISISALSGAVDRLRQHVVSKLTGRLTGTESPAIRSDIAASATQEPNITAATSSRNET